MNCNFCNEETREGGNFCSYCGSVLTESNGDILKDFLTMMKVLIKNPMAYIRTASTMNIINTVIMALIIMIVNATTSKIRLKDSYMDVNFFVVMFGTLIGVLILVAAMFLGCKILKKQISFMVLLNTILSIVFILTIINTIAGILSLLSTVLASIITGIMAIASLLLIYEGLNEVISINGKEGLVLIISVFVVVIIIGFLIAAILI